MAYDNPSLSSKHNNLFPANSEDIENIMQDIEGPSKFPRIYRRAARLL
jgi:hypothetical protein